MRFESQKFYLTCQHTIHKYFAEHTPCQQARHMTETRYDAMSHHVTPTYRNQEVLRGIPSTPIKEFRA
jgi:hypothetical protein